ncbi:4-hydroxythreonine-4-phosphate dehydrogenase PdxA [Companilactobacillus keshanensis]|uniref:4-hydroxythreonine-4-phosphate dehydrogenase PdxA n=1 Tax=Companilactobacillus keshanensis TaxID=2486003 RepID=A0ABW4BRW0_9LACO|nr:4-hydroxythreonine-4-phosphate dehydrogenase PdxA [Companilactobacillus keshanensis]
MKLPIIAITMGDPASIGPEISLKAFKHEELFEKCRPFIVGDVSVLNYVMEEIPDLKIKLNSISEVSEAKFEFGSMDVLDMHLVDIDKLKFGQVSAMAGDAAYKYVTTVIDLAMNKEVDATVTNALNKEAMNLAGHHFAGHTEIYASRTGTKNYTMMLAHENLRVVHVSTHVSLKRATELVKKPRVLEVIEIANKAMRQLGISNPKIGVAGLNPHSSENGLFGDEEEKEIIPAINAAKDEGIDVTGPVPPDTVFPKAVGGWFDIVVAMYHDQGHIPIKLIGFKYDQKTKTWGNVSGVNITLGLPIIRTSVDHGTAFDQVLTGKANDISLLNSIDYATKLAINK